MDGVFYNEALDGVLNHPHHHLHHHHHHNGETGGHGYGAMTRNLNLNLSLNVNLSAADAHEALALTSPDLHVLRLTSPELERLIMQSCGGSNASTPVAGGPPRVFPAPKRGADEHDAFAPEEFRCHQRMNGDPDEDVPPPPPPPVAHGTSHSFEEQLSQTWGDTAISAYPDAPPCAHLPQFACAPALKDESQKVPETPPLSPIDMEDQERIKAERKRMRNRVAASKCRKRKLERLARLEERVSRLSGENGELRGAADTLRDQVAQLRHQLLDHIKSGCKLLSQQLQTVTEF